MPGPLAHDRGSAADSEPRPSGSGLAWLPPSSLWRFSARWRFPAQTLEQAEALRKARRYEDANDVFRDLVRQGPQERRSTACAGAGYVPGALAGRRTPTDLFNEALETRQGHAPALPGHGAGGRRRLRRRRRRIWRSKALEPIPSWWRPRNCWRGWRWKTTTTPRPPRKRIRRWRSTPIPCRPRPSWPPWTGWRDKKETPWDPHDARGYETAGHFFMLNRRYEESASRSTARPWRSTRSCDRARSQLGVNLMRLGRTKKPTSSSKTCWNNGFQDDRHQELADLMDSYKNFVTFQTDRTILKLHKKEARPAAPVFRSRDASASSPLTRRSTSCKLDPAGAGGSLSGPRGFRRAHAGHAGPGRAGRDLRHTRSPWTAPPAARPASSIGPPRCGTK